jgi:hypothetical protein
MRIGKQAGSIAALLCVAAAVGCSALPGASVVPSPSAGGAPSAASPAPPESPSASPTVGTAPPPASQTGAPPSSVAAHPSGSPHAGPPSQAGPPPLGTLAANGIPPVAGELGSWCSGGRCVDVGGANKRSLPTLTLANSGAALTFAMPAGITFVHWSAWYAASLQGRPVILGEGGSIYDVDAPPVTAYPQLAMAAFAAPPGGDWALAVQLGFDGGDGGDATYYWRVVVP